MAEVNKNIFGLDISDRALRLIKLNKKGKKILISSYNDLAIPAEIIKNGEIKNGEKLIKLLNQLVKSAKGKKIKSKNVITVLPETKTFIKVIKIPATDNKDQLPDLVKEEIKNHIPLNIDEIYLDWQILKQNSDSIQLLVGAAAKNIVDSYFSVLEKSGLTPYVFEIEGAAIIRSLITANDKKARIIIDFGAMRTGLIVYDQGTIQFTASLPISGNKITQTISKTLRLDIEKAEKSKVVCGLDPKKCEGALLKILLKSMENLTGQIKKAMVFYKTNFSESNQIAEIVLCGGGG